MTNETTFAVGTVDGEWYYTTKREAYDAAQAIAREMRTHADVYRHIGSDVQLAAEFEADGDYTLHFLVGRS